MVRILVVKLSSIGDVVQALPVAEALRRRHPGARLTWAAESWTAPLVEGHRAVDRVVRFPRFAWMEALRAPRRWAAELAAAVASLREERYDVALDLQGLFKSAAVLLWSRAPRRLGIEGRREGSWLVSERVPTGRGRVHAVREYLAGAAALGAATDPVTFGLEASPAARATVAKRLLADGRPRVGVNPAAAAVAKTPPPETWAGIVRGLAPLGRVVLAGSERERDAHARIARLAGVDLTDLTGLTSLPELVAVLETADLHVAPDTGSAHVAAALGTPVVSIHGPTSPSRLSPWLREDAVVHHPERCGRTCPTLCVRRTCLRAVSPEDVVIRARTLL